jgi:hypothetical protein
VLGADHAAVLRRIADRRASGRLVCRHPAGPEPGGCGQLGRRPHACHRRPARERPLLGADAVRRCPNGALLPHNSAATIEQVIDHYQALFRFIEFLDVEGGLFAPPANGQGCDRGTCGIRPIPEDQIAGLIAYFRKL